MRNTRGWRHLSNQHKELEVGRALVDVLRARGEVLMIL
jgi:hypothetical protein